MFNEIEKKMKDIKYGYVDIDSNIRTDEDYSLYKLQTPKELLDSKHGICWDQVELERYFLKEYQTKTYFMVYYGTKRCPSHTFIVIEYDNKYYWYEHSWNKYKGIHEYDNLDELLKDVSIKQINDIKNTGIKNFNIKQFCVYEYLTPKFGINGNKFYKHCEKGKNIIIYI
jgi:Transglutaminase-like domain.